MVLYEAEFIANQRYHMLNHKSYFLSISKQFHVLDESWAITSESSIPMLNQEPPSDAMCH